MIILIYMGNIIRQTEVYQIYRPEGSGIEIRILGRKKFETVAYLEDNSSSCCGPYFEGGVELNLEQIDFLKKTINSLNNYFNCDTVRGYRQRALEESVNPFCIWNEIKEKYDLSSDYDTQRK
jgi:hypothetical protein